MKSFGLIAIALLCSIGVAVAQQPPTGVVAPQVTLSPDEVKDMIAKNVHQYGRLPKHQARVLGVVPNQIGVIVFHATNCLVEPTSAGDVFIVFSSEIPGGGIVTIDPAIASTWQVGCVDGHAEEIGIDPVTGAISFLVTFPHG